MELGTIVVTGQSHAKGSPSPRGTTNYTSANTPIAVWDVLGQSVLQRTVNRVRNSGISLISIINNQGYSGKSQAEPWERAVLEYARMGVEKILLISLGAYSEIDFESLIRSHSESGCKVTNVSDERGPLGISVINTNALGEDTLLRSRLSALSSCSSSYEFSGYSNRLETPADYRRLVLHGLTGMCQLTPVGKQIAPGVWVGDGARISKSVRVLGPAYVGGGSRLRAGAFVAGGSSIERHCDIDCGTVIENSSVLPKTYLGPGLHVSQSVVNGSRLTHLGRNLEVDLSDTNLIGLAGSRTSRRILETLGSLFTFGSEPAPTLSTPSRAPASLDYVRSQSFFD